MEGVTKEEMTEIVSVREMIEETIEESKQNKIEMRVDQLFIFIVTLFLGQKLTFSQAKPNSFDRCSVFVQ
jgi:hypothetical protein